MRRFKPGQSTIFEYRPGMSIKDMGGTFSRSTVAQYFDSTGLVKTAAIDELRDGHFIDGVKSTLLERDSTNSVIWNRDLTNAAWVKSAATAVKNAAGPDGVANSASTLTEDTSNAAHFATGTATNFTGGAKQAISVMVKANGRTRGLFYLQSTVPTTADRFGVDFNLTAETLTNFTQGAGTVLRTKITRLANGWYWIWVVGTFASDKTAGSVVLRLETAAGAASYVGDGVSGMQWDYAQHEIDREYVTSPIATTTAAVTRSADNLNFPWLQDPPQDITGYVKFVELGSMFESNVPGYWGITGTTGSIPRFIVYTEYGSGGRLTTQICNDTVCTGTSDSPPARIGQVIEIRSVYMPGATNQTGQGVSYDGGAESVTSFGNIAVPAAWASPGMLYVGSRGNVAGMAGAVAIQALRIMSGVQTLDTMRYDYYAAVTSESAEFVHLIELQFSGGTVRLCTGAQDIFWKKPTVIVARKTVNLGTSPAPAVSRLRGLGFNVTERYAATLAECRNFGVVVIDCYAWSLDEFNTFIQQLLADGQRVLMSGNDSGVFFSAAQSAISPVGAAIQAGAVHPVWTGVTTMTVDGDGGVHITALTSGAVAYGRYSNDANGFSVIEVPGTNGGLGLFVPVFNLTGNDTDQFFRNAVNYLGRGYSWEAVGGLLELGGVEETNDAKGQGVDLKLSAVDQTTLAALLANQYRGRPVKIWRAHLNRTTGQIVDEPLLLLQGLQLNPYTVEEDRKFEGGTVTISTRIASYFGIDRVRGIQSNVVSHAHQYPGDTFFQNAAALQNTKIYWGTTVPQTPGRSGGTSGGEGGNNLGPEAFHP